MFDELLLPHVAPNVSALFVVVLTVTSCAVPFIDCRVTAVADVGMSTHPYDRIAPLEPIVITSHSTTISHCHADMAVVVVTVPDVHSADPATPP